MTLFSWIARWAAVSGAVAAAACLTAACSGGAPASSTAPTPVAVTAPVSTPTPTPTPATTPANSGATALDLSGRWTGSGQDGLGPETFTWNLSQTGTTLSGSVSMRPPSLTDGSCGSCHKVKDGAVTGSVSGNTVTLRMAFTLGGTQPTPTCLVTLDVTAANVTATTISSTYNGSDSCEPSVALGTITMSRQ